MPLPDSLIAGVGNGGGSCMERGADQGKQQEDAYVTACMSCTGCCEDVRKGTCGLRSVPGQIGLWRESSLKSSRRGFSVGPSDGPPHVDPGCQRMVESSGCGVAACGAASTSMNIASGAFINARRLRAAAALFSSYTLLLNAHCKLGPDTRSKLFLNRS